MMNQRLETPAHLASKNGHSDIVNTFIQMSNETIMTETYVLFFNSPFLFNIRDNINACMYFE